MKKRMLISCSVKIFFSESQLLKSSPEERQQCLLGAKHCDSHSMCVPKPTLQGKTCQSPPVCRTEAWAGQGPSSWSYVQDKAGAPT